MARPAKRKYGNRPTHIGGVRFDSAGEARRWAELQLLERAGEISELRRQVPHELHAPGGEKVGKIVVDFEYVDGDGSIVTEDFKSPATAAEKLFTWKARHFLAEYGRTVRVVKTARGVPPTGRAA
jgi:hypothetical protein